MKLPCSSVPVTKHVGMDQDPRKKNFPKFFAYYFLKVHLRHPSQIKLIKGHEEFTKQLTSRFFLPFYLMIHTSDQQIRTREAQKLTDPDLEHCPLVLPVLDILFL